MGFTCKICERTFPMDRQTGICPACNSLIRQMSKLIPYQERAQILRQQMKYGVFGGVPVGSPVTLKDTLQMKACQRCVWSRQVDKNQLRVRCSLPSCAKAWGKQWRKNT